MSNSNDDKTESTDNEPDPTTVEVEIRDDRSILTIEGRRDVSVVVRSQSGERIYLPPESHDDEPTTTTPYSTTPYSTTSSGDEEDDEEDNTGPDVTPYSTSVDASVEVAENVDYGRKSLPQGIRIVHPEPVTDVRVLH